MKKIFTFCVSLLAALSVFAYDFQSGDLFYNITSSSAPYTVEVTYQEYSLSYTGLTSVIIPETVTYEGTIYSVTSIGEGAFSGCSSLTSVTIPNSVTSIGERAFSSSSSLTSMIVENGNTIYDSRENCNAIIETATNTLIAGCQNTIIPNSVTSIGDYAFYDCSSLTSITIPNSVTSIGYAAFANCSSLTSVIIGSNVTSIGVCAFQFCSAVSSIIIPSNVTSIGNWAFGDCSSLTSITIPKTVSNIGINPFAGCSGLSSIVVENGNAIYDSRGNCNAIVETATNTLISGCQNTIIPNDVTSIGSYAFGKCSLIFITIPNSVISIGGNAFADCSFLTSITIPNSVTSIGDYAFDDCSSLTSVTIPNSVTSIGELAFLGCSSLTSITIPNSVTSIEYGTFWGCSSLTSITIPNSVTSIETLALLGCSSLDTIYVEATTPTTLGQNVFEGTPSPLCVIPCGTLAEYEMSRWKNYVEAFVFDDTCEDKWCGDNLYWKYRNGVLTLIGTGDMYDYASDIDVPWYDVHDKITSINIPNGVSKIGSNAFASCISLDEIYVEAAMPPALGNNALASSPSCFIPCGAIATYQSSNWANQVGVFEEVCPAVVKAKVPASWEDDDITVWVWTDGAGTEYPTTKEGDWYVYTHTDTEEFNIIFKSGTGWKDEMYHRTQTVDIKGITENTCLEIQPTTGKATYTIVDCEMIVDTTEYFITYTSTDGNIVTPHDTTGFGANIVSNTYENGVGTITFDGPVTSIGNDAFEDCTSLTSITIPNSVTSIGRYAFHGCDGLTSVTIPYSVTSIGVSAFAECSYLTSIIIPNGVKSIGGRAFAYCRSLTSITIPNSVTSIGNSVLGGCDSLTSIVVEEGNTIYDSRNNCNAIIETATNSLIAGCQNTIIPNSVTSIGSYAFHSCDGLTSITIPNSVTSIGKYAFDNCHSLTSVIIPNSVTSIGESAFYYCRSFTSITIPEGVTSIGEGAFEGCSSLDTIHVEATTPPTLGENVLGYLPVFTSSPLCYLPCGTLSAYEASDWANYMGEFVEEGCIDPTWQITYTSSNDSIVTPHATDVFGANIVSNTYENGVGTITFDGPVTSIGEEAFYHCTSLASITIPNSVISIGVAAFSNCGSLNFMVIPEGVTTIGSNAFQQCFSLQSIYIPRSVTSIGDAIFIIASMLGTIVVDDSNMVYDSRSNCNAIIETATNTLIAGCQNTVIPNSVATIGNEAFAHCYDLTSITIPNSVTSIGDRAFYVCSSLTSITIPNSVTSIGDYAFSSCSGLTSIVVEGGNATYDSRENCNAIIETATNTLIAGCKNTIIPNSVTSIGADAFYSCKGLTSITIPNSVTSIGEYAFSGCSSLTSITIPNSVTSIGDDAFWGCSSLTSITIPNSVTSIGDWAFCNCSSLTSITIPNSIMSIARAAFYGCSSLDTIHVEATTPPALEDSTVFMNTPSPICVIPCGTLAAYEASDWANYMGEFVEEGCAPIQKCGDDLYWEFADGVLTITGTGDMYDYAADTDVPWYDVRGNIKTVSLPDAMTKIGQNAFYKCTNMTTINMPISLTAIGEKAFAQDTKLTGELTLPASLTTIDERAFFNCKAVTAFHIEATTPPTLQDKAFDYVVSPIHVPCGYGHVYGKHAQWGMLNLEMCELLQDNVYYYPIDGHTARAVTYHSNPTDTIVIPSAVVIDGVLRTVTEVADYAFTDCDNLPAIYFNEGLEYIGERAFVRCYGLKGTITLPTTLTTIGERAFSYCDNVEKYLLQAMTPPTLGADVFTGNNKNALFYISCEAMDDYKVATNWSSLKSRLRDACLNIYHYNTPFPLGTNGVYTTEDTLVASIYYRRKFTPYRWETLYLPFEVDRVTVLEDGEEFDLRPWNIITGGDYYLAKPDGMLNLEILFDFTDELEAHTPYIIQFVYDYYRDKIITFYGKESWNKLSTSFEVLSSSAWMQIAGNTTLQDQLLEKPVYMLRSGLDFILQKTTTTLHPFECYVMPYTVQSGAPARMSVRLRDDVATAVESMKGNESRLAYTINGNTLTVYPQGQAFSIYSLNGALIYSSEAGKEAVDCELNSGCYLLHAGTEAHKIML